METNCKKCLHTHICCKDFAPALTAIENRSGFYSKTKVVEMTENNVIVGFVIVLEKKKNGSCIHYNDTRKLCDIYDYRPTACKTFSCIGRIE